MPSIMQRVGTPNERHNKDIKYRAQLENVDPSLTQYNDVVRQRSLEAIYAEHLQPAFDAFNARQKRKDRRLDVKWGVSTALELQRAMDEKARASKNEIDQKGRPPIREIVWQIGNPAQGYGCAGQTPEHRQKVKEMLLECQAEAERRYPQFAWGDLVFHADEVTQDAEDEEHGSLHLHSEFVPLCFRNKQGPDVQVAMERCLLEMGFSSFDAWKHDLDALMEDVLHRHGLERTVMGNTEKHQKSSEFHRQQARIRETKALEAKKQALEASCDALEIKHSDLEQANSRLSADAELLRMQNADLRDAVEEAAELHTMAQYQAQVIENDLMIDNIRRTVNDLAFEARHQGLGWEAAKSFITIVLDGMADIFEAIRIRINRVKLFERLHNLFDRPGERQEQTFEDLLANAYSRAESGSGGRVGREEEETK